MNPRFALHQPLHAWLKHLDPSIDYPWLRVRADNDNSPLRVESGERLIESKGGTCLLYRVAVGKGQLIYMGWQVADSMPHGRLPRSVETEMAIEEQVQILSKIVRDVYLTLPGEQH
jgi:hypothetical protein